jgi:hypothetical protein
MNVNLRTLNSEVNELATDSARNRGKSRAGFAKTGQHGLIEENRRIYPGRSPKIQGFACPRTL